MARFNIDWTPVPLTLEWIQVEGNHIITLEAKGEPERRKTLYSGKSLSDANKVWKDTQQHYEGRRGE